MSRFPEMLGVRCVCSLAAGFFALAASAVDIGANTTWTATEAATHAHDDIVLASGVTLTVNLAESTDAVTLGGVISGGGALKLTGKGELALAGANTFSGGLTIENPAPASAKSTDYALTSVTVRHASALGSGKVTFDSYVSIVWLDADGDYANAFDFRQVGRLAIARTAKRTVTLSGPITGVCDAIVGEGEKVSGKGGSLTMAATCTVDLMGGHDLIFAVRESTATRLYGKVTARALRCSSNNYPDYYYYYDLGFAQGTIYLYNDNDVDIVSLQGPSCLLCDGATFRDRTQFTDSFLRPDQSYRPACRYYVNTDNLRVGCLTVSHLEKAPAIVPSLTQGLWYGHTSERTLTIVGGSNYVSHAQFMDHPENKGKLSVVWDPPTDDARIILSNRAHTTSGSLTVKRGEVDVVGAQASMASLSALTVQSGARFLLDTAVADPLAGLRTLTAASDATVTLPANTTCQLTSLVVDGSKTPDGQYTGVQFSWLKGTGVTLSVSGSVWTKADCEGLAKPLEVLSGGKLTIRTVKGETIRFTQPIVGAGSVEVKGDGEIYFSAANTYAGGLTISGPATVHATDEKGLGAGTVTVTDAAWVWLEKDGGNFANDFVLSAWAVLYPAATSPTATLTVSGDITASDHVFIADSQDNTASSGNGATINFTGAISVPDHYLTFIGENNKSTMNFYGPIEATSVRNACAFFTSGCPDRSFQNKGFGTSSHYFHAENKIKVVSPSNAAFYPRHPRAFTEETTLTDAWWRNESYHHTSSIDFGGFSMTVRSIQLLDMKDFTITEKGGQGVLRSGTAATLTVVGGDTYASDAYLQGKLSLDWNPPDDDSTLILSNRAHTTSGKLTVSRGEVDAVGATAAFKSLTAIEIKAGARFVLDTAVADALAAVQQVDIAAGGRLVITGASNPFSGKTACVNILGDGALELGDGVTAKFAIVRVNGTAVGDTTYTKGTATWLKGDGAVTVDSSVLSVNVWKHASDGTWGDAARWTRGVPTSGQAVLVDAAGGDYAVSVEAATAPVGGLDVRNAGAGTAEIALKAGLTVQEAKPLDIGSGGRVDVQANGLLTLDAGTDDSKYSGAKRVTIHDGGELLVSGGTVAASGRGHVSVEKGGKLTMTAGSLVNDQSQLPNPRIGPVTVEEGGLMSLTGEAELLFSTKGWQADALLVKQGGTLDVAGHAVVGPMDGTSSISVFGDGTVRFREYATFGRDAQNGVGGWGYLFSAGSGGPTGCVEFLDHAKIYDIGASFKIDRGAVSRVARLELKSDAEHLFNACVWVGMGDGRGEWLMTDGLATIGSNGLHVPGAYERQNVLAPKPSQGEVWLRGGTIKVNARNYSNGEFHGVMIGNNSVATTNAQGQTVEHDYDGRFHLEGGVLNLADSSALIVGIGTPNAKGLFEQTGGTLVDSVDNVQAPVVVGMGGGTGTWMMSGGEATLAGSLHVGGLTLTEMGRTTPVTKPGAATQSARFYCGDRYPNRAEGLLSVVGGTLTVAKNLVLSADGTGTLELGANGKLVVNGALDARAGSKLVIDVTGYAGKSKTLASFKTVATAFADGNIETVGLDTLPAGSRLEISTNRIRIHSGNGSLLLVR